MSVRGLLEQGPAATEEAASFGEEISFGGKKTRQSYDAVARFQLESRAGNHDFWDRKVKKATVPEQPAPGFSCCNLSFASCEVRCNLP